MSTPRAGRADGSSSDHYACPALAQSWASLPFAQCTEGRASITSKSTGRMLLFAHLVHVWGPFPCIQTLRAEFCVLQLCSAHSSRESRRLNQLARPRYVSRSSIDSNCYLCARNGNRRVHVLNSRWRGRTDEVRNYLFGKDPAQYACYRAWAQEIGVPALKGLLPHVGGEVVGFWLSTDSCPTPEVEGSERHRSTPTNVTWVIRWPSKAARDAGWEAVDASPE